METLRVSKTSKPASVAGAIAGSLRQNQTIEINVIGASSINQAIKAIAIARGYLAPIGIDLVCKPSFSEIEINGEKRTSIKLTCENK